jgi:phage terminase large subunit-like protein
VSANSRTSRPSRRVEGWPPRILTPVPAGDRRRREPGFDKTTGARVIGFIDALCRVTKDSIAGRAGEPIELFGWQEQLINHVFARRPDGRLRHRQALIGVPRKNGKSSIAAGIGLAGLALGPDGGEVYSCAADKDQARIVFDTARRMVELEPDLAEVLKVYRNVIEYSAKGSVYRVLSAEAYTKEGLNPHLVVFDEVHAQPTRELWDVMALAMGSRREPLLLGITTAGVRTDQTGHDSLCFQLYQYGKRVAAGEVTDPAFFMAWWEAAKGADHRDPQTWRDANPGFGRIVDPEDFATSVLTTPEVEFRIKRTNQWVATADGWFPAGLWESLTDVTKSIPDGAEVVLAFDGSYSGDSTGLTVHTVGAEEHIDVAGLWERPFDAVEWQVNQDEVEVTLRACFERWRVRQCVYDPRIWQQLMQRLAAEDYPMEPMSQGQPMIAASQRFFEDAANHRFTQSGDVRLARHIANCVVKLTPQGPRVQKETANSPRKIDLGICAVMGHAYASAQQQVSQPFALWG